MRVPNGGSLLRPLKRRSTSGARARILDEAYRGSFGRLHVPGGNRHAMRPFGERVGATRVAVAGRAAQNARLCSKSRNSFRESDPNYRATFARKYSGSFRQFYRKMEQKF